MKIVNASHLARAEERVSSLEDALTSARQQMNGHEDKILAAHIRSLEHDLAEFQGAVAKFQRSDASVARRKPRSTSRTTRGTGNAAARPPMNKKELAAAVAVKAQMSKAQAQVAVDAVLETIKHSLSESHDVRLLGFGTFSVAKRPATEGRNPRTGEKIKIKASKVAKFKVGKGLKDALN